MTIQQQNHIGNALIFMCRYSFHRKTSADMATNSALKSLWEYLDRGHQNIIIDEIESELDVIDDNWLWKDFLKWEKSNEVK